MAARRWQHAESIALDQLGLITHQQLQSCGFASSSIHQAVGSRRLTRVHRGVFSLGPIAADPRVRLLAAVLAAGPGAAASHWSAASHQGLIAPWAGPIAVTVPTAGGRSRPGIRIHRRQLRAVELTTFDAVPCTTPARTILDLCEASSQLGERALRAAGAKGLLRLPELHRILAINHGRRGTARMRVLVDGHRPVPAFTRSEFERLAFKLCERFRLPLPDMNAEIWAGGMIYECDCVWPNERLIIECDSRWHDNPVTARRDAHRDEALTLTGWRVHRIRWAQLIASPERVAATIGQLIRNQRRLLSVADRR